MRLLRPIAVFMLLCGAALAADEPGLTKEQIKQFLATAKVVGSKHADRGTTTPWHLTLSDGSLTHDAAFQTIDEHKPFVKMATGATYVNFVDSYKYDVAAYRLAELLGIDDLVPVTVPRKWRGTEGAMSWWLPVMMDDLERIKRKVEPPDPAAWNQQMRRIRVLDELVYDIDVNLTNVLIGRDWHLWRIDFSRAFRLNHDLQNPKDLARCDRRLFERLKALSGQELAERTKGYLTQQEVDALMARRDKIVALFQKLIAEKGESEVLY